MLTNIVRRRKIKISMEIECDGQGKMAGVKSKEMKSETYSPESYSRSLVSYLMLSDT